MLQQGHKTWEIIEEHRFRQELNAIEDDSIRADEFIDGAKNALSRNPRFGSQIGDRVWFLPMSLHDAVIYYTFDDDHVYFQSIQVITISEAEEA